LPLATFRNRRAASIENEHLRVTILQEGGHVAEILNKKSGVNPLWIPPWNSIEPSTYSPEKHPEYGADVESKLLSGIMGHNLCLDIFGGPSPDEAAAGLGVHGEASVVRYEISETNGTLRLSADLPQSAIRLERRIELHGANVGFLEVVENLSSADRPIGWTQHVTLGPPFIERGGTQFRSSATRSKVFEADFGSAPYLEAGAEFTWPIAPRMGGGTADLRVYNDAPVSGGFTTHLMEARPEHAFFTAFSPSHKLAIGYIWKQADFPWLGIWEENCSRANPPWNSQAITRGMEFGVSPFPESRREMVDRGKLFGVPTYRWLPAKRRLKTEYWAIVQNVERIPESLAWPGQLRE
jgi:hypothetical protein